MGSQASLGRLRIVKTGSDRTKTEAKAKLKERLRPSPASTVQYS
jgi:hypothetical protein